jgi:permease MlaE
MAMAHLFGIFLFVLAIASCTMNGHLSDSLAGTTDLVVKSFEWFGNLTIFCGRVVRAVFLPPYEGREFVHQFDELGSKSLPLVALAGAATGVVLTLSTRDSLIRFGAKSFLPAIVVFSIIKESGPIITALVVSGRAAAGIGAELGAMNLTEQIDAMGASAVDPYKFLVATRVLACMLMLPLLTETRAKVVRDYLTQNFKLDDKRVKTVGLGKTKEAVESSKVVIFVYSLKLPANPPHAPSPSGL